MSVEYQGRTYQVIDAHIHAFPDKIAEGAVARLQGISGITPCTNGTVGNTLEKLAATGVDRGFFLNIATSPRQQTSVNNSAAELSRVYPERVSAFGSVHFRAEDSLVELERIKALGLPGIKLHPDYQGFSIDDPELDPIYEKCAELKLPIVFHAGWDFYSPDRIHASPKAARRVLDRFPGLTIVLAHFGGMKQWDEVERWLIGRDVWLDTAMCATYGDPVQMRRMILSHDPQRILLGSDCPWEDPASSIRFILSLGLSESLTRSILAQNAQRFLGLA